MPRHLHLALTLALGLCLGGCGLIGGHTQAGDGGVTDAGDGGGTTGWCGQNAPPAATNLCCASCTQGQSGCQTNGCYGGWWCDTSSCKCVSPTAACNSNPPDGGNDGGGGSDGGGGNDGGNVNPGGLGLACTVNSGYNHNESTGSCGAWRWSIKTGTDSAAGGVNLSNVQTTTISHLVSLAAPSQITNGNGMYLPRQAPTETTVFELKNVHLSFDKLEDDSDYHLVVSDGTNSMIIEVPYPGCVGASSPWSCTISHARNEVEQYLLPQTIAGHPSYTVSVVGVGFFDEVHGQTGVAPNGIELHPVLRICFGMGCDPLQAP